MSEVLPYSLACLRTLEKLHIGSDCAIEVPEDVVVVSPVFSRLQIDRTCTVSLELPDDAAAVENEAMILLIGLCANLTDLTINLKTEQGPRQPNQAHPCNSTGATVIHFRRSETNEKRLPGLRRAYTGFHPYILHILEAHPAPI